MPPEGGSSDDRLMRELDRLHTSVDNLSKKLDEVVANRLGKIEIQLASVKPENYVTQDQFKPMARLFWFIVFSFAGIVVSAVGSLVIQSKVTVPTVHEAPK